MSRARPGFFGRQNALQGLDRGIRLKYNILIMDFVPQKIFFTKGVGVHREQLASFELALRDAGIAAFNLVPVSSIFPPNCQKISREEGLKILKPGSIFIALLPGSPPMNPIA